MKGRSASEPTYQGHFAVDLGGISTLAVGVLKCCQLQQAHAKGVNVHAVIILLIIQLWCHELRSAYRPSISFENTERFFSEQGKIHRAKPKYQQPTAAGEKQLNNPPRTL